MINYEDLANRYIDMYCENASVEECIIDLHEYGLTKEDLIELRFNEKDIDDALNVFWFGTKKEVNFMKAKEFYYKGFNFKPVGNIIGGWLIKQNCVSYKDFLEIDGYTHADFYKVAKKNHASCDLFEVNGAIYIPCDTKLARIMGKPKIKYIDEYNRRYH